MTRVLVVAMGRKNRGGITSAEDGRAVAALSLSQGADFLEG